MNQFSFHVIKMSNILYLLIKKNINYCITFIFKFLKLRVNILLNIIDIYTYF